MTPSITCFFNALSLATIWRLGWALVLGLVLSQAAQAQSPAFWRAIETNDINSLRTELMRGANPNARHPDHGPAIVAAARFKAFDVVRVLASLNATDVDAASVADETALMLVSTLGDRRSFDALLQRGAQVNRPGWTALHYAASGGQLELVKVLIEQHAFIDAQSPNNTTPLMMAARMRALPVVQYLVDQGADPSLRNQAGLDAAAYLERSGERQWAIWMKERAQRYVARYGTVEQPRWTASESSDGGGPGGSAQTDLAPVQMNREVSVAPEARRPSTGGPIGSAVSAPGQAGGAARPAAASQAPAQQGGGTASTGAKQPPAVAPRPASQGASASVAPSQSPQSAIPKPAAPPVLSIPTPVSPVAPAARAPAASTTPAAPAPAATTKPVSPIPPAAARPVAPTAPTPTAGAGGAAAAQQPKDSEPLFFSRTLSIPADPPSATPSR
jgi:hypothetical protein